MLVLSRKIGERVLIGSEIVVTVVRIGPNSVRLGIDAPKHLNIVREEIEVPASVLGNLVTLNGVEACGAIDVELVAAGDLVEA